MEISNFSSMTNIFSVYQAAGIKKPDSQAMVMGKDKSNNSDPNDIEDRAEISQESKDLLLQDKVSQATSTDKMAGEKELTPDEKEQVNKLKQTDKEVKVHEQAHMAASGGMATGAPSYTYEKGPDDKEYAVGGEVNIRVTSDEKPEKTIEKAEQTKRAALAPTDPSSQDRNVARQADQMIQSARTELEKDQSGSNRSSEFPKVIAGVF